MPKRPDSRTSVHDLCVAREARKLQRAGWDVKTDLPNFDKPNPIGKDNRVPDIEATKRSNRRIVEVETPKSITTGNKQLEPFRRHAAQKPNTKLDVIVTDK